MAAEGATRRGRGFGRQAPHHQRDGRRIGARRRTLAILLALTLVCGGSLLAGAGPATAAPPPSGPYVTVLLGRAMWTQSEKGKAVAGQPTLYDLAALFAQRGVRATGVIVPGRTANTTISNINGNLYASWAHLATLRDTYGWSFVSNGQNRLDLTTLSPAQQRAESCGSLAAFQQRGHNRAWGMFGPESNHITDAIARNVVGTCFAFVRLYSGKNLNNRAAVVNPPYYARTDDTNGGTCNQPPCSGSSGLSKRYMLPSEMITDLKQAGTNQWVILSTYKLVKGSKLSGNRRWDCTGAVGKHWTSEIESYCLNDFLSVLNAIRPGMTVTDPVGVARAWGRVPG